MLEDRTNQAEEQDFVSSANSPASKTEQIQELVNALASNYQEVSRSKPGRALKAALPGRDLPGRDLELYGTWLAEAHRYFRDASHQNVSLTYASEWVLDNYYIIRQALQQIEEDLPSGYYQQLPKLTGSPLKAFPRIYAIARAVLSSQHLLLDPIDLQAILIQFQERVPLTMGELWALPIFLRYGLIEFLAHALVSAIRPPNPPDLPAAVPLLPGTGDPLSGWDTTAGETANNNSVANIIFSLRAISEQNWSDFFESVSCLERTLREDPAGISRPATCTVKRLKHSHLPPAGTRASWPRPHLNWLAPPSQAVPRSYRRVQRPPQRLLWAYTPDRMDEQARWMILFRQVTVHMSVSICSGKAGLRLNSRLATSRARKRHSSVGFYCMPVLFISPIFFC
jgi:hypothetical protein